MKYIYTLLIISIVFTSLLVAKDVEIDLGPGYANDVWYSYENGVVMTSPKDNWDLAFSSDAQEAGIWINSQKGMALWIVPNSDGDSWLDPIDTTGMAATWIQGFNSELKWSLGAFNLGMDGFETGGDFGWGEYNMVTHSITGSKVFVLKMDENTYKRIMVEGLQSGVYTIKWADLDGQNEQSKDVAKAGFSEKLFAYLDLKYNIFIDREPDFKDWDLLFGKYTALIQMGPSQVVPYGVTGVRMNRDLRASVVEGIPTEESTAPVLNDENYSGAIGAIGSNWKKLNYDTFQYEILDSLSYFVTSSMNDDPSPTIFKMVFKTFEGSSTGKLSFELNDGTNSVEYVEAEDLIRVFPNIVSTNSVLNIESVSDMNFNNANIKIYDIRGNTNTKFSYELSSNGHSLSINLNGIAKGIYFVSLDLYHKIYFAKFIVN